MKVVIAVLVKIGYMDVATHEEDIYDIINVINVIVNIKIDLFIFFK